VQNIPWAQKIVWTRPIVLLFDEDQVEARLVCLEIVLIWAQDGCTISAEHTIGSEIILDVLDGTPR
jgi:hypothetical protein